MDWYTNVSKIGDYLYVRGVKNGKPQAERILYEPVVYIETERETGFTSIDGKNLKPLRFDTLRECHDFTNQHKESNLKIYGFPHWHHQYILDNYADTENKWDRKHIRTFNIDIEVFSDEGFPTPREAAFPITAICLHDSFTDKFVVFATGSWKKENSELPKEIVDKTFFVPCKDEFTLMKNFISYWKDFPPDIVTGWNVEFFDMPYIHNRMINLGFEPRKLSPHHFIFCKEVPTAHGNEQSIDMYGISVLDYMTMYKKQKVQDSYRLDNIAEIELGQKKLDYSEVAGLHNLYKENFQKYIDYNIQDVNLVKELDEKLGLIDAQIAAATMACINYDETSSVTRTWDALINKEMSFSNQKPIYHQTKKELTKTIAGGYVKEPQVGKHGWCMSFDLNSLYPHLIMQYNISPETLHQTYQLWPESSDQARLERFINREEFDAPPNHCVAASGHAYDTSFEGIIPRIMRRMYKERKAMKKIMLEKQKRGESYAYEDLRQYVLKISLNSGYGAYANRYYRWFDVRLGESITLSGQLAIRTSEKAINDWMNKLLKTDEDYVIAIDTDSNYVNVQPLVDKFFADKTREQIVDILDKVAEEQVQKVIADGYDQLAEYTRAFENAMVMEREAIASSAFWTAKKRYAMAVWNMEGVAFKDDPKIKIQGLEAIRSSTPASCRKPLLELIKLTLMEDEETVQAFVAEFKEKFMAMPEEDISMPRSMNNVTRQTRKDLQFNKGTPPHVRGAIMYNRLLEKYDLKNWETIKDGEKGKFIYLRVPNNVGTDVISFATSIPDEFNVRQYIDKELMFQKVILDPAKNILEPIGWTAEKQNDLLDFFN